MMTLLSRDENAIFELDFKIECACDVGAEKGPLTKKLILSRLIALAFSHSLGPMQTSSNVSS